jgi:hypothetical protein
MCLPLLYLLAVSTFNFVFNIKSIGNHAEKKYFIYKLYTAPIQVF